MLHFSAGSAGRKIESPRMEVLYTGEDVERLGLKGRFELIRGEIVTLTPPGFEHGEVAANASFLIKGHSQRGGGRVVVESGVYTERNPDTVRGPDISYWRHHRLTGNPAGFVSIPPDLAVEVVSPNDTSQEIEQKVQEYLRAGVIRVWVLYPRTRTLHVFEPGGRCQVLQASEQLNDPELLPGFSCLVAEFFPSPE
ncbi:Uma2 family endonuclease [bacterium CPR1]|nr:Uma2 family endonuclease [bacterium CPR1]